MLAGTAFSEAFITFGKTNMMTKKLCPKNHLISSNVLALGMFLLKRDLH